MASVWAAREVSPTSGKQRIVAVKVMLPELAKDPTFRSMFLNEGGITGSIQHENVVRVFEVAESQGLLYMAMEWIEGDSLQTLINVARQRRPIPSEMAVRIVADAAAGLHAAQELRGWDGELRGIVHCDVSPHNILIGPSGVAKLVDFGVASALAKKEGHQEDERIGGKFGYMSPEQAMGREIDRRSDIFSLGVVLYELTTGRRLFKGRNPTHTLTLVTSGQIPSPSTLVSDYPPRLEEIVFHALERDVNRRFQTAEEMQKALEAYLVEARILVPRAGVGQLVRRVLGDRLRQRRLALRRAIDKLGGERSVLPVPPDQEPVSEATASTSSALSSTVPDPWSQTDLSGLRSQRRPLTAAVVALGLAVCCAVGYVVLRGPGPTSTIVVGPPDGAPNAAAARTEPARGISSNTPASGADSALAIDELPPENADQDAGVTAPPATPRRTTPTRPTTPATTPVKPADSAKVKGGTEAVVLEEQPERPKPPPKPKPESTNPCGCKVTDFACTLRCVKTGK
ncbi:MAG: serine/threonine protein kinase [Polyangiaceae bacterium]|nr:serine/threonine protein kinase [Polyangiaceae bacterium]